MVKDRQKSIQLFKILAHPTRLGILEVLRGGEQCVCHMEAILGLRQAHISQHLMILRDAGVVTDRRDGWNIFYRVTKPDVYPILAAARKMVGEADIALEEGLAGPVGSRACPCPRCNSDDRQAKGESVSELIQPFDAC